MIPQKRKLDLDDSYAFTNGNDQTTTGDVPTATPPKLRRILAKYPDQNSFNRSSPDIEERYNSKSVVDSHLAFESLDAIMKHHRKTSFRILRANLLQRDAIARMDDRAYIIDDIYDMNGEINSLAWPLTVQVPIEPFKPKTITPPIIPTRVLRSRLRPSSSPASSRGPTPIPTIPPAPPIPSPLTRAPSEKPPKPSPLPPSSVKTESTTAKVQPYKRLPCRGDTIQMRIAKLQADPWSDVSKLTAKTVFCVGCEKQVSLDKRFDYYPGFWETHKRRCPFVLSGKTKQGKVVNINST
ncbi:hypothetical protein BDP27DRAFT_1342151 [Rhodocollybia butyracea]|uniref:Uncharacterized protein n=1 Tax=Rhodocollybia butyracea TaxID=206335 RepID=A0A9P5PBI7_9AGAR|nr:hypothetical protein BDP27DRAFT_1342151 [Rhodocollybia butyracea]